MEEQNCRENEAKLEYKKKYYHKFVKNFDIKAYEKRGLPPIAPKTVKTVKHKKQAESIHITKPF